MTILTTEKKGYLFHLTGNDNDSLLSHIIFGYITNYHGLDNDVNSLSKLVGIPSDKLKTRYLKDRLAGIVTIPKWTRFIERLVDIIKKNNLIDKKDDKIDDAAIVDNLKKLEKLLDININFITQPSENIKNNSINILASSETLLNKSGRLPGYWVYVPESQWKSYI